jgi:uncharacterized protein YndB with AHSA1/START domain
MRPRSVTHASFVLERVYPVSPAQLFAAFATTRAKAQWFGAPDEGTETLELDFRVGGREQSEGRSPSGGRFRYEAIYRDIIPNERIVYAYDMHVDEIRISVSLTTIELQPEAGATRLTLTEYGAYLDGLDTPGEREHGVGWLLDRLGEVLAPGLVAQ